MTTGYTANTYWRHTSTMKHLASSILLVVGCASSVYAAPPAESATPEWAAVTGTGQFSCGKFIEYKTANNKMQMELFVQWIGGFMTAYNFRGNFGKQWWRLDSGVVHSLPDFPTIILYVDKHCHAHPLDTVLDATMALIQDSGGNVVWKDYKAH